MDYMQAGFSSCLLGHSGSTYWTKRDSEKAEIFRKVEPYLTFLNIPAAGNARFLKNHVKYRSSFPCTRASGKSGVSWNIPHHIDGTHDSMLRFYNGIMYVNPIS